MIWPRVMLRLQPTLTTWLCPCWTGYGWLCLGTFFRNTMVEVIKTELRLSGPDNPQRYAILGLMVSQGFWLWLLSG